MAKANEILKLLLWTIQQADNAPTKAKAFERLACADGLAEDLRSQVSHMLGGASFRAHQKP